MIAGAQLMVVLDATIVNIALPHIQSALHFSTTGLSWVLNAYTLTFGGLLLLGGRAGDILGRRRVFITGILLFSLASLLGGLASSSGWLLAARALQGVGGAIASPTALALVTTNFAEGPARNRAFGVFAAASGSSAAVGSCSAPLPHRSLGTFGRGVARGCRRLVCGVTCLGQAMSGRGDRCWGSGRRGRGGVGRLGGWRSGSSSRARAPASQSR